MTPAESEAQIRMRAADTLQAGVEENDRKRDTRNDGTRNEGKLPLKLQRELIEDLRREARELNP